MTLQKNKTVRLFDKFSFVIPPKLTYHTDGLPGQRVLFISDKKKTFTVSFEEGMKMMDMTPDTDKNAPAVSHQWCKDGKYIRQRCGGSTIERCAFFHIELKNVEGKTLYLPGQIVVDKDYQWTEGVEPVLLKLLDCITVSMMKGGG